MTFEAFTVVRRARDEGFAGHEYEGSCSYLKTSFGRVRLLALSCCLLGTSLPTGGFAFSAADHFCVFFGFGGSVDVRRFVRPCGRTGDVLGELWW